MFQEGCHEGTGANDGLYPCNAMCSTTLQGPAIFSLLFLGQEEGILGSNNRASPSVNILSVVVDSAGPSHSGQALGTVESIKGHQGYEYLGVGSLFRKGAGTRGLGQDIQPSLLQLQRTEGSSRRQSLLKKRSSEIKYR